MSEFFKPDGEFTIAGNVPIKKFSSKGSELTIYFAEVDTQVINGYFAFGSDRPESSSIESLLYHLDSSGGLLPRPMRGDILRPAWQFHGADNPLADRDQSCFVCCALGENAFLGTFSCCIYLLQNIEAVFDLHGVQSKNFDKKYFSSAEVADGDHETTADDDLDDANDNLVSEPKINSREFYVLSETGEGAMAWEATLQSMYPGVRSFWNRLLLETKNKITGELRDVYDKLFRPENLTVVITGKIEEKDHIFEVLHEFEFDYFEHHAHRPTFKRPWSQNLPKLNLKESLLNEIRFLPRNTSREPGACICFGWRGCQASDVEKMMSLKVLTAHVAVSPFWDSFVTGGLAHRISWCQLEYAEAASLITIHGIGSDEAVENVIQKSHQLLKSLSKGSKDEILKIEDLRKMSDRICCHYIREMECEPNLVLASALTKSERYGSGFPEQVNMRLNIKQVFQNLEKKPLEYWIQLYDQYFLNNGPVVTKVMPKSYEKMEIGPQGDEMGPAPGSEGAGEMSFATGSKRASSRPRRKANPFGEECGRDEDVLGGTEGKPKETTSSKEGSIEKALKEASFPFGDQEKEIKEFENRLEMTEVFLEHVTKSQVNSIDYKTYRSDDKEQHPLFPVNDLPFFTFLEDIDASFVYMTMVLDTTHLDESARKLLAPITAAFGAILCPRPPGLDTDAEIVDPNEFNPPLTLIDSQVSLGLNGEMMQHLFMTLIVRPSEYDWAVGMFHYLLKNNLFTPSFLRFVCTEASRGLASNYRMQTAESPKYECFDASEINLHSLVKLVYKQESNARLFVGRRRLDLVIDFLAELEKDEAGITKLANDTWRQIADTGKTVLQIGGSVQRMAQTQQDLPKVWKTLFPNEPKSKIFSEIFPTCEKDMMNEIPKGGICLTVNQARPSCLSLGIPINPNEEDFPKLCIASQLFSMAQKWIWACLDEDDVASPAVRMPCSFANVLTLNLESSDILGSFELMKKIMDPNWPWLKSLLIATKLMVVNDPASLEMGVQGTINAALLSHLNNQSKNLRRELLADSVKVTLEDIKQVIDKHLQNLFDPENSWAALMSQGDEKDKLLARFEEKGYKFKEMSLTEMCGSL